MEGTDLTGAFPGKGTDLAVLRFPCWRLKVLHQGTASVYRRFIADEFPSRQASGASLPIK